MNGVIDGSVPIPSLEFKLFGKGRMVYDDRAAALQALTLFKNTIYSMTRNNMRMVNKIYQNKGVTGAALASANLTAMSFAFYMAHDTLYSVLTNKEPAFQRSKIHENGTNHIFNNSTTRYS